MIFFVVLSPFSFRLFLFGILSILSYSNSPDNILFMHIDNSRNRNNQFGNCRKKCVVLLFTSETFGCCVFSFFYFKKFALRQQPTLQEHTLPQERLQKSATPETTLQEPAVLRKSGMSQAMLLQKPAISQDGLQNQASRVRFL